MDKYQMLLNRVARIVQQYEGALIDAQVSRSQMEQSAQEQIESLQKEVQRLRQQLGEREDNAIERSDNANASDANGQRPDDLRPAGRSVS